MRVKAVHVEESISIARGKQKQDILVADATGNERVTIWQDEIGKIQKDPSYTLSGMMVRDVRGKKYLPTSKQNSQIAEIDDIGVIEVHEDDEEQEGAASSWQHWDDVRVIGVDKFESYAACLKCTGRVVADGEDHDLGECTKCQMIQSIDDCNRIITALLMLKSVHGERVALWAFGPPIFDIAERSTLPDITARLLIKAKAFAMSHSDGVIRSVSRK